MATVANGPAVLPPAYVSIHPSICRLIGSDFFTSDETRPETFDRSFTFQIGSDPPRQKGRTHNKKRALHALGQWQTHTEAKHAQLCSSTWRC